MHTMICRISEPPKDLALSYIVQALGQSEQDKPGDVFFGATCGNEFTWLVEGHSCSITMPPGLRGSQVRVALMALAGFDDSRPFPKQSEFILEIENKKEDDIDQAPVWRMRWLVSLAKPEDPIALKRMP
jgi:hypothetical protein